MSKTTDRAKNCLFFWGQMSRDAETLGIANIALSVGGTARMVEGLLEEIDRLRDELSAANSGDRQSITLADAERGALSRAAEWLVTLAATRKEIQGASYLVHDAATLRGLLSKCALSTR